jgi:murein DD-endopeptidase MepM/ murein hydrolase activator NlpD
VIFAPVPGGVYYLDSAEDEPEVVAYDRRGAHMVWPSAGNISTYFHESGPYWIGGYHQGLDIASHWGWNVFAAWDGVVVHSGTGWNRGYGNQIVIDHRNGIQTRYAHLSYSFMEVGDRVVAGELIGLIGSTGAAEGPHLHFEVIVDEQLRDPLMYLPEDPEREYVG